MRAPTGTRIEETAALCDRVEAVIRQQIPQSELVSMIDNIGLPYSSINLSYSNSAPIGPGDADILAELSKDHHPTAEYVHDLRIELAKDFPGVTFYFLPADIVSQILNFGLPAPIDIQILGRNLADNRVFADRLLNRLKFVPGTVDLRIQQAFDQPKLHIDVDRTKAQQVGYSARDVATNLLISLSGSFQTSPTYWLDQRTGVSYSIATQTPQYRVDTLQDLENVPITGPGTPQSEIMASVASFSRGAEMGVVSHYNIMPVIDIYGAVQGRDLGGLSREIEPILERQQKRFAARLANHRSRSDSHHGLVLLRIALGLGLLHRSGLPVDRRQFSILARSLYYSHGAARRARRHRLVSFHHPHHRQRAGADRRHHVHGRGHRQQHPGRQLFERAPRRREDGCGSRFRIRLHALPPRADDRARHDHRHVAHVSGLGRGRRTERAAGPRRNRRPDVRHCRDAVFCAGNLQHRARRAREKTFRRWAE